MNTISTVIAAVGGGAVTAIVDGKQMFRPYSIGLAVGFFAYFIVGLLVYGSSTTQAWMGD